MAPFEARSTSVLRGDNSPHKPVLACSTQLSYLSRMNAVGIHSRLSLFLFASAWAWAVAVCAQGTQHKKRRSKK